jgi:two-component system NtrC family sensor kinase
LVISKVILRPIYDMLNTIDQSDYSKGIVEVAESNNTELGLLAKSFNDLGRRTYESQQALRANVKELEGANSEIKEAQTRLVHAAKMASLGQLVAGVAHELNNPIGFIYSNMAHLKEYSEKLISLLDIAEKDPAQLPRAKEEADLEFIKKDLPKLIASCEDGARRTRDIVLGLRNFSRLEESQVKEVDVREGLSKTLELLSGELKNRIKVIKDFGDIPKIMAYPSELNQVFMNILSNAAQAIEGEGEIRVSTHLTKNKMVEIAISDTGKGMSKETAEKVFDPFFTTKTLGQGTGLGLSISYGVIQKHGGEILIDSEVGKGTTFRIILPVNGVS